MIVNGLYKALITKKGKTREKTKKEWNENDEKCWHKTYKYGYSL